MQTRTSAEVRPIRVLLVNDDAGVRDDLRRILGAHDDIVLVGEADCASGAVTLAAELDPDVVLMDQRMASEVNGLDGTPASRVDETVPRVVLLTGAVGRAVVRKYPVSDDWKENEASF